MPAEPSASGHGPPTLRERYRSQVRHEVKQVALGQLAEAGPAGVSVSAIGKQLGVSGPALYRYFASRDDLLTELVIDAYDDLAGALSDAAGLAGREPRARFEALVRAYRSWALAQPHRYGLLFGPPLPGYDAHAQRLVDAAQAVMNLLIETLRELGHRPAPSPGQPLASQLLAWARRHGLDVDPEVALHGVLIWGRIHGLVSLEIAGNFASMGIDPDQVFDLQLAALTA